MLYTTTTGSPAACAMPTGALRRLCLAHTRLLDGLLLPREPVGVSPKPVAEPLVPVV